MAPFKTADAFAPPAPYPGSKDLSGIAARLRNARSQIGSLPKAVYEAAAWRPPLPGMPLFVMAPELVQTVLLSEAHKFSHGALFERIMTPAWGNGLLLAQGDDWKTQRRAAAQSFRAGGMQAFVPTFIAQTQALIADWEAQGFGELDLHEQMKRLTFDIIVEAMLSGADQIDREMFRQTVQSFFSDVSKMKASYVLRGDAYHEGRSSADSPLRAEIMAHIAGLIEYRRSAAPRGDLIDLLLIAKDPHTGTPLSDAQLADNLLGFILAGYETTAAALTWTFYLVSAHEQSEARLLDEYRNSATDNPSELGFTRQVISEALRIYPPAYMLTRVAAEGTRLGGHRVKKGARVNIPIWAIHRNAEIWPEPHKFDPDRFGPDAPEPPRYSYMPFGAGPRICIAAAFAMTEMSCVVPTILSQVKITPPPRASVWPKTELALVPQEKMMVQTSKR